MKRPARVGIIGAGFGARVHVPAFRRDPRFDVVGLAASRAERADAVARQIGIPRTFARWQDLIDDPEIDVVSVAVPPSAQPQILERAVNAGKHLFAEKPLGGGGEFCQRLAAAADERGLCHVVDFEFTEIDVFQRARQALIAGSIGRVRHASVAWHLESAAHKQGLHEGWKTSKSAGAGVLGLFLSHSLYYLEWLLSRQISDLRARSISDPELGADAADDVVHASLLLEGKLPVAIAASSCSRAGNGHRIEIHGDTGALVLENIHSDYISGFELCWFDAPGKVKERVRSAWQPEPGVDGRVAAVAGLVARLGQWLEDGTRGEPNLRDGARIEALLERARVDGTA
jgi:predicted dehydrogenase